MEQDLGWRKKPLVIPNEIVEFKLRNENCRAHEKVPKPNMPNTQAWSAHLLFQRFWFSTSPLHGWEMLRL